MPRKYLSLSLSSCPLGGIEELGLKIRDHALFEQFFHNIAHPVFASAGPSHTLVRPLLVTLRKGSMKFARKCQSFTMKLKITAFTGWIARLCFGVLPCWSQLPKVRVEKTDLATRFYCVSGHLWGNEPLLLASSAHGTPRNHCISVLRRSMIGVATNSPQATWIPKGVWTTLRTEVK